MTPSDAVVIDNLTDRKGFTFRFESNQIASSSGASSERSNLILHNLSEEALRVLYQDNAVVIIEAGYEGKTTLCYTGDVVSIQPNRNLPDISYKIQLASEANAVRNTMINTHYDESISTGDIIKDMATRFPSTSLATYGLDDYYSRYKTGGTGFTGSLITNFDNYCRKNNLQYTLSNSKLIIIPFRLKGKDFDTFKSTNFTLAEDSIKHVAPVLDTTKVGNESAQSKIRKLQINTFYLPVEIGQFVTIPYSESLKKYAGTYMVKGRRVILESKGNAWDVVLEVEELTQ